LRESEATKRRDDRRALRNDPESLQRFSEKLWPIKERKRDDDSTKSHHFNATKETPAGDAG
jgi:hypothetical protein